jgi:hypothetical protein
MHDVRRVLLILSLVAVLPLGAAGRAAADPECAPDAPPFDIQRPAGCQRIMYRYGPLHVVPGDNLILFGPVSIERPPGDGYVVRFKPDLVRLDGTVPDIDILHLHHAVWISTAFDHPMFASGEEKTIIDLPAGYGIPVRPWDVWALNYMLHNQTPVPENVYITYEIDFIPKASAQGITPVRPHWLNVSSGANPVYNTIRRYGGPDGECSYPRERCADLDPYLRDQPGNGTGDVTSIPAACGRRWTCAGAACRRACSRPTPCTSIPQAPCRGTCRWRSRSRRSGSGSAMVTSSSSTASTTPPTGRGMRAWASWSRSSPPPIHPSPMRTARSTRSSRTATCRRRAITAETTSTPSTPRPNRTCR